MMEILLLILSLALVVGGIVEFRRSDPKPALGIVFLVLGILALGYLAYLHFGDVPLPTIDISFNWPLISFVAALVFVIIGCFCGSGFVAIGLMCGFWFLFITIVPSIGFLVFGMVAGVLLLVYTGTGIAWVAASAALSLAASSVFAFYTVVNDTVTQLRTALVAQLVDNNKHFESYDQMCLAAQPGSEVALICGAINQNTADIADLKVKVDANTTAIATLTGQMATVTEKADDQQVVIQSDPSSDDAAAAALAQELAAAGWGPDNVSVNNVNEDGKIDQQGNNAFGSRIRTKAKLVEVLNGSSTQETAIRDRVTSQLPESERARALSGEGWYAIQFKQSLCISGSDWFQDGQSYNGDGHVDCHEAGDVYWVYVGSDGKIYWGAAVRDDCNNPHLDTAPAPQGTEQAEAVCPEDSARAGQMIGSGCNPGQPETPTGGTPESSTPGTTPSGSTPTTSTPTTGSTTPTTSTPVTSTPTTTTETTVSCSPGEHPNPPGVGGCGKDDLSPRNSDHTTAASPPGAPETTAVAPSQTADPSVTPGAPVTSVLAPDASPTPTQAAEAPSAGAGNVPTSAATGDQDPDSR